MDKIKNILEWGDDNSPTSRSCVFLVDVYH